MADTKNRTFTSLTFLCVLGGCASADGSVLVKWERQSFDDLQKTCAPGPLGNLYNARFGGCYRKVGDKCVIYTQAPKGVHDVDVHGALGHELRHCFVGRFHP